MDKERFRSDRLYFYVADYDALPTGDVSVFVPRRGLYMLKVAMRYIRQQKTWVDEIISDVLYQPPDGEVWDGILATIDEMEGFLMAPYERVLADFTLESAQTYVDITGLDYVETGPWKLTMFVHNPLEVTVSYLFYINADYTDLNYHSQVLSASSSTVSSVRPSNPITTYLPADSASVQSGMIAMAPDGYVTYLSLSSRYGDGYVDFVSRYTSHDDAQENVTEIRIAASETNGIGIGSRFLLTRMGV